MIHLTRINHVPLVINSDLIEHVEITPDTVISMMSGQKFMVLESAEELIRRIIEFRREICAGYDSCNLRPRPPALPPKTDSDDEED
jgi:flagellar protein FlbD